jgi:hypothetical protein
VSVGGGGEVQSKFDITCEWNGNPTRGGDSRAGATNSRGA